MMNWNEFAEFLTLPEHERWKIAKKRLHWWQLIPYYFANKLWTIGIKDYDLPPIVVWESWYKGRF